jgi:hypothetical protein
MIIYDEITNICSITFKHDMEIGRTKRLEIDDSFTVIYDIDADEVAAIEIQDSTRGDYVYNAMQDFLCRRTTHKDGKPTCEFFEKLHKERTAVFPPGDKKGL